MTTVESDSGVELLEKLGKGPDGTSPLGCMQCGLCAASCPLGSAMEFPPRKLILQASAGNLEKVLSSPSLWMCVACYTCSKRCPRGIELTDGLWPACATRRCSRDPAAGRAAGDVPEHLQVRQHAGQSPRQRLDWAKDLDVRVLDLSKEPRPVDVLWLVGCYPSYYPRNQLVARAFARILTELGAVWGVLGAKKKAIGECDRMFGEERLFETLVEGIASCWTSRSFARSWCLDPHAFRRCRSSIRA